MGHRAKPVVPTSPVHVPGLASPPLALRLVGLTFAMLCLTNCHSRPTKSLHVHLIVALQIRSRNKFLVRPVRLNAPNTLPLLHRAKRPQPKLALRLGGYRRVANLQTKSD